MAETLLVMKDIQKYFPGVHALDNACLEVRSGEVVALVGENGAGKSTLMKVLTGIYRKDGGTVIYKGQEVEITSPQEAQKLGIGIIHQELNLMGHLSVAENIYIGREPMRGCVIDQKKIMQDTRTLLDSLHISIDPAVQVNRLTVAKQQVVEIAKALSFENTSVLVMDEPSAALTESEIEDLFSFIRQLKAKGVGIVYISHRMDELKEISDRITVMRDGQYVGTVETRETPMEQIISMMVGRVIYEEPKTVSAVAQDAPVVLRCRGLCSRDVKDVSFELHRGEILGFSGLMGAGRTETMRLVCGADPRDSGTIEIKGRVADIKTPSDAVRAGIGYLSEDRKRYGLCLGLSVADNIALPTMEAFSGSVIVDDRKIKQTAQEYKERINVKTPTVETQVVSLSGGNQQKVVLAKWLVRDCDVLIFDEPTRGIDVGAKNEIYKLMNQLVKEGKSIIMISSEMPELLRMSDRICVMCEGRLTGTLRIEDASQEKIMSLATPGATAAQ